LKSITTLAFILGFAHEEEFVVLAVAAGSGGNPLTIMIAYASSVAVALIGITILSIKVYKCFQHEIIHYSKYIPKITAISQYYTYSDSNIRRTIFCRKGKDYRSERTWP
jgi:nickel/cobalt exporter